MKEKIEDLKKEYQGEFHRRKTYFIDPNRPLMILERLIEDQIKNDNIIDPIEWNKWLTQRVLGYSPIMEEGGVYERAYWDFIYAKYMRPCNMVHEDGRPSIFTCGLSTSWQLKYLSLPEIEDKSKIYDDLFPLPSDQELEEEIQNEIWQEVYARVDELYYEIPVEQKENFCLDLERMIEEWDKKCKMEKKNANNN